MYTRLLKSIREIVFGLEDSLVSTVGVVVGMAAGTADTRLVTLTGIVLVIVEALSMAAGSFLSSQSHQRLLRKTLLEQHKNANHSRQLTPTELHQLEEEDLPTTAAVVMGVAYILGGLVPISPFFFLPIDTAIVVAFTATAVALFALGYWSGSVTGDNKTRTAVEMLVVSSIAAVLGYIIGKVVGGWFGIKV